MKLTREAIASGYIRRMINWRAAGVSVMDEAALEDNRLATLARRPADARELWLFGYGSLMWNPAFHFAESAPARLFGHHRRYCLSSPLGRGTPERPGITMGLAPGGSCHGIAYRLAEDKVESESRIVWLREMVSGAYRPIWTRLSMAGRRAMALTFAVNRDHERYVAELSEDRLVEMLATAGGDLGSCADYLFATVRHLEELDLHDRALHRLRGLVERRIARDG